MHFCEVAEKQKAKLIVFPECVLSLEANNKIFKTEALEHLFSYFFIEKQDD